MMNSFVCNYEDTHWEVQDLIISINKVDFEKRFLNIPDNCDLIEIN